MALTPRIKSAIFFTSGFILFTVSAIVYTIYNHKTHYQYGVLIDSGNPNITISLYRWPVDRYNKTGLAELAETCISNDLTEYLANSSDLSPVFQPCLSRVIGSLDNDEPTSTSSASQLFFTVSGSLFLLNMTSHQEVSSLVDSVSAYLSNNTKLNVQPVTFIDDENGAIYPWIAVNSLEARTHSESIGSPKHSGVIEISYTESSISLEVKNTSLIPPEQVNSLVDISLFGKNHSLYGKKYSCFGSDKGRLRYIIELIVDSRESTLGDPCLPIGVNQTINTQDLIQMRDPCLHTSKSMELNKEYTLMGKGDGPACSKMISDLLDKSKCEDNPATCYKSPSIAPDDVVYTAVADLLYPVTVLKLPANHSIDENDYFNQSISLCGMSRDDLLITSGGKLAPTSLCFQLLYNYHIIQDVFGLKGNWSKIVFDPSLRGDSTINWSTGFMINATSSIPNLTAPKHWISTICCIVLITIAAAYLVCGFYFLIASLRAQRVPNKEIYQPIQQQPQP